MNRDKVSETYEIEADQRDWLAQMAQEYNLRNPSKALRVLLDFAIEDGDRAEIFEKIRCTRC